MVVLFLYVFDRLKSSYFFNNFIQVLPELWSICQVEFHYLQEDR